MHCATAFKAAAEEEVLETLDATTQRIIRKQVVTMVLATDLAQHFSTLAKFKAKVAKFQQGFSDSQEEVDELGSGGGGSAPVLQAMLRGETDDRMDVLCMCIKNSDIGHAAKPWKLHQQWSKRILQEFFNQGDIERGRGMAISSLCDRQATDVWKGQIGFIDFLAMPQAKAWCDVLDSPKVTQQIIDSMVDNKTQWGLKISEGGGQDAFTDAQQLRDSFFELAGSWNNPSAAQTLGLGLGKVPSKGPSKMSTKLDPIREKTKMEDADEATLPSGVRIR
jgi:cAMP-specific phosphodiesterase 4